MSSGKLHVRLREILNSERIVSCQSLNKDNISFWEENIDSDAEESLDSIKICLMKELTRSWKPF